MFEEVQRLLAENAEISDVGKPQSDEAIEDAAQRLGVTFPMSFVAYLKRWGRISFGPLEFLGLGTEVYNTVDTTLRVRRDRGLPSNLVVVCDHEGDEYVCLDTGSIQNRECPVVIWDSPAQMVSRWRARDFEKFLESDISDFLC